VTACRVERSNAWTKLQGIDRISSAIAVSFDCNKENPGKIKCLKPLFIWLETLSVCMLEPRDGFVRPVRRRLWVSLGRLYTAGFVRHALPKATRDYRLCCQFAVNGISFSDVVVLLAAFALLSLLVSKGGDESTGFLRSLYVFCWVPFTCPCVSSNLVYSDCVSVLLHVLLHGV
jgi:hypothetical protein